MVTLHGILQVEANRLQEQGHRLIHCNLGEFVVYLLYLTHDAVEGDHVASGTCGNEVGADNLDIGQSCNVVVVCAEAEYEVTFADGVVASLL